MIKETIQAEIDRICEEIDSDPEQEKATLEGWEDALKWVLNQLEGESNE